MKIEDNLDTIITTSTLPLVLSPLRTTQTGGTSWSCVRICARKDAECMVLTRDEMVLGQGTQKTTEHRFSLEPYASVQAENVTSMLTMSSLSWLVSVRFVLWRLYRN